MINLFNHFNFGTKYLLKMKNSLLIIFLFLSAIGTQAQKLKKAEKAIVNDLKTTVFYLADDKLEGRRTGSPGEEMAAQYIVEKFKETGLQPKGEDGSYLQTFPVHDGRKLLEGTYLRLAGDEIDTTSYLTLSFGADGSAKGMVSPAIHEDNEPWFSDIGFLLSENENNPHFDLDGTLKKMAAGYKSKGATAVIFYTSGEADPDIRFDGKSKEERLKIPVIYIRKKAAEKYLKAKEEFVNISFNIKTGEQPRSGRNVIGYIDNGAPYTIVIGAHFDHLGYGQDHNSLWAGEPQIHNGADDNASGTALIIETAKLLKNAKYKNNNYLFICFSGEELGLYGSKYFTENPTISLESVNFMINCDMVGRLNEETKTITVGGYGTSPYWSSLPSRTKFFDVKFDSSGIGPSDHTSFYLKDIPVLFFFTGTHTDYHKPSDDAEKINFNGQLRIIQYIMDIVKNVNNSGKIAFTKTREPEMGKSPRFTVSLGVMPDYTYSGKGLKVDGVISGRVAEGAGMKAGDIITKIGEYDVTDINNYMKALSHFKKGDKTTIEFLQGDVTKSADIQF